MKDFKKPPFQQKAIAIGFTVSIHLIAVVGLLYLGMSKAPEPPKPIKTVLIKPEDLKPLLETESAETTHENVAEQITQTAEPALEPAPVIPTPAAVPTPPAPQVDTQKAAQAAEAQARAERQAAEAKQIAERQKLEAERLKAQGVDYLDAPVSGQTIGAENATLTVMVGGDAAAFERALPAMQAVGKLIKHVGESGAGFAVKAVNNMLMAVHLCAACEGATTLKAHGVNLTEAFECINASSGQSTVTSSILPNRIFNRSFPLTFALPLLAKDTGIALDLVREAKLAAPVIGLSQNLIQAANALVDADSDFSTVAKMYESWSKITIE